MRTLPRLGSGRNTTPAVEVTGINNRGQVVAFFGSFGHTALPALEVLPRTATFIVRVVEGESGELTGTVERALTEEKHAFRGVDTLPSLIVSLVALGSTDPRAPGSTPPLSARTFERGRTGERVWIDGLADVGRHVAEMLARGEAEAIHEA